MKFKTSGENAQARKAPAFPPSVWRIFATYLLRMHVSHSLMVSHRYPDSGFTNGLHKLQP